MITGKKDAIAVNHQVRILENGSELMTLVTGTGCLLGAVLAASIHLADEDSLLDLFGRGPIGLFDRWRNGRAENLTTRNLPD